LLRAYFYAALASDALFLRVQFHGFFRKPLRVVAPHATQGTSLHEDGSPDAWPVVDGKPLDVED
jgi:hypothetical protein